MKLFPAVDILDGRSVRLLRGSYDDVTEYGQDPVGVAMSWAEEGAKQLHVVDLDGAREGTRSNVDLVTHLASDCPVPIQVGGGIRDLGSIEELLEAGVWRVVIGTAAMRNPTLLEEALRLFGTERIVVSVDTRDGKVSVGGWMEDSGISVEQAVRDLSVRGVGHFLHTSIETDGTLQGPDIDLLGAVAASTKATILASGGVGDLEDLESLRHHAATNVEGVIVGKALYEQKFTVSQAKRALGET